MTTLFGTDGIRSRAGEFPLDSGTVSKIGAAFAHVFATRLGREPRFVSGRDTRESGMEIETSFHKGAAFGGAVGESVGVITTPGVAFLTRAFDFDAGIVISASHNPFHDNGIKIFLPSGQKLDDKGEKAIEEAVANMSDTQFPDVRLNEGRASELRAAYADHHANHFADLNLTGTTIVADCANGSASEFLPDLYLEIGADVVVINASPDGQNINKDCGSLHLERLQESVLHERADFGV